MGGEACTLMYYIVCYSRLSTRIILVLNVRILTWPYQNISNHALAVRPGVQCKGLHEESWAVPRRHEWYARSFDRATNTQQRIMTNTAMPYLLIACVIWDRIRFSERWVYVSWMVNWAISSRLNVRHTAALDYPHQSWSALKDGMRDLRELLLASEQLCVLFYSCVTFPESARWLQSRNFLWWNLWVDCHTRVHTTVYGAYPQTHFQSPFKLTLTCLRFLKDNFKSNKRHFTWIRHINR